MLAVLTLKLFLESCFFIFANTRKASGFEPEPEPEVCGVRDCEGEGETVEENAGAESRDDDGNEDGLRLDK